MVADVPVPIPEDELKEEPDSGLLRFAPLALVALPLVLLLLLVLPLEAVPPLTKPVEYSRRLGYIYIWSSINLCN